MESTRVLKRLKEHELYGHPVRYFTADVIDLTHKCIVYA